MMRAVQIKSARMICARFFNIGDIKWFDDRKTSYGIPFSEYSALKALYDATDGDNWTDNTNWFVPGTAAADWFGVTVSDNRVTHLGLSSNNLIGEIPPELGNLKNLTRLYLYTNHLNGMIPPELGNLANMTHLLINDNQLTGAIPAELGNLTNLTQLYLNTNQLTGTIPVELGNLVSLTRLYLYTNQLTGTIPVELGSLTNLTSLHFSTNQLTGTIPVELGSLTNLTQLILDTNQLTGAIPTELGDLASLTKLFLYSNGFTSTEMSTFVGDLWPNRITLGGNSCSINIWTTDALSTDASDAIEGTDTGGSGLYTGDGLQQAGCTVTWTA